MNIHDVYIADIYTVTKKKYNVDSIDFRGEYTRTSIILRIKPEYSYRIEYKDLLADRKIKADMSDCYQGEEYVNYKQTYRPITEYLGLNDFTLKRNNISKKKLLKMVRQKIELDRLKQEKECLSFVEYKNKFAKENIYHKILRKIKKSKKGDK